MNVQGCPDSTTGLDYLQYACVGNFQEERHLTETILKRARPASVPVEKNDPFARQALQPRDPAPPQSEPSALIAQGKDFRGSHVSATARLRHAIEQRELSLHYQPQYELRDGHNCGVEALARWFLPNDESIAPTTFIPHAEKHGLIAALGAWVLQEACATVANWCRGAERPPILCVNTLKP